MRDKSNTLRLAFASIIILVGFAIVGLTSLAKSEIRDTSHPASFSERWAPVDGAMRSGVFVQQNSNEK
jgi:hypothetical protein